MLKWLTTVPRLWKALSLNTFSTLDLFPVLHAYIVALNPPMMCPYPERVLRRSKLRPSKFSEQTLAKQWYISTHGEHYRLPCQEKRIGGST